MKDASPTAERDYKRLSNGSIVLIFACALVPWLFFVQRDQDVQGFVAALSVCAVLAVGSVLRGYRDRASFWCTLAGIALVHVPFVFLIHWPEELRGQGMVFAPLVIVDMYASSKLVEFVVKWRDA